jgi:hypothetical protein
MLWRENYKKYKDICEVGQALFVEGMYKKSFKGDRWNFDISDIRMLASIGESMTKSITVKVPLSLLDENLYSHLMKATKTHKGPHKLKLLFVDETSDLRLSTFSKAKKVHVNHEFVDMLHELGLSYKIN